MRAALLAAVLLMAPQAMAFAQELPALFDVTGVASSDVLNVRERPDAASPVIGTLAPDATGIEVVEANEDRTWGLVNTGERSGWASLGYLARQEGQAGRMPKIRQCFGTEPFWSLSLDGAALDLSRLDAPSLQGLVSGRHASISRPGRFVYRGHLRSEDAGPLQIILSLRTEACGDGMSDRAYGIELDMLVTDPDPQDGVHPPFLYSGCCTLAPQ